MKVLTKDSIEEFKKLKSWVRKCPIEAAMEIEELRLDKINRLKREGEQGKEINKLLETLLTVDDLAKQARMHWLQDKPSLVLLRIDLIVEEIKAMKK